jgi:hypothetical protein
MPTTNRLRVVVRHPLYDRRSIYGYHIPETVEYEGEVVPNPKWVTADSFCLTTGDAQFPYRVIDKESIVHGWQLPSSSASKAESTAPQASSLTYQVQSKGKTYLVTRTGNKLSCNCTGFSYRRTCSHIKEVA